MRIVLLCVKLSILTHVQHCADVISTVTNVGIADINCLNIWIGCKTQIVIRMDPDQNQSSHLMRLTGLFNIFSMLTVDFKKIDVQIRMANVLCRIYRFISLSVG